MKHQFRKVFVEGNEDATRLNGQVEHGAIPRTGIGFGDPGDVDSRLSQGGRAVRATWPSCLNRSDTPPV